MSVALDYAVRPYRHEDREQLVGLLGTALAGGPTGARTGAFFDWKHQANPFGPSVVLVAEVDGQVVGLRAFLRWRFRTRERVVRAVRAVDTATHPDFQRRGIFSALTRAALEACRPTTAIVFNTPNAASLPGYLKLGWIVVGTVPISVRPVRPVRFAAGLPRASRGAPPGPPPPCRLDPVGEALAAAAPVADLLAEANGDRGGLATDRSLAYLRWRYADPPGLDYRAVTRWRGSALAGLAIGRLRRRGPLTELVLSEVIVRPGDGGTARWLLRAVTRAGCDHVAAALPDPPLARAGVRGGYVRWPTVGMILVANPLAPVEPPPGRLDSWRLALGDLELF